MKRFRKNKRVTLEMQGTYYTLVPGDTLDVHVDITIEGQKVAVIKPIPVKVVAIV